MSDSNKSSDTNYVKKRCGAGGLLLRIGIPIGFLYAGYLGFTILSQKVERPESPPAKSQFIRTKVTELNRQNYRVVIKTNGIVQPHNQVVLSAQVSGLVIGINPEFEVGSYFSQGDVLVELDPRDYVTAIALAKSQHVSAVSELKHAQETLDRVKHLQDRGGGSDFEVEQSIANLAQAEARVDGAQAQVDQANRDLDRTQILAPYNGRVRQKLVGLGQLVGPGTPLGEVFNIDYAEVRLPIAGRELQMLDLPEHEGDAPVEVELCDATQPDSPKTWRAEIVRTEGVLDENTLELFAIARVDDPFGLQSGAPPLRIGQPVVGSIEGHMLTNVLALPRGAVRQLDKVYLVDGAKLTLISKTITPVWSDEDYVIVRDTTIPEGELLSTTRLVYAPDGAKVEIIPDIELVADEGPTGSDAESKSLAN